MSRAVLLVFLAAPAAAAPAFEKEGVRLSSAVLQAVTGSYPTARAYYIRGSSQVFSATTADGLVFVEEAGVRLSSLTVPTIDIAVSSITGLSILPLNAGGLRMLYSVAGTTGAFRIYSATSADGLAWANDTGTAVNVNGGLTFAQYPSLAKLSNGDWRLYYIQDFNGGDQEADRQVFTALSTNEGRNWGAGSVAVAQRAGQVGASLRTDNKVRLYYTAPLTGETTNTTILSALSADVNGASFSLENGVRLSTSPTSVGSVAFPMLARSTEAAPAFRWRLYYNFAPPWVAVSTSDIHSAATHDPNPQSDSPSTVFKHEPAKSHSILGEIFSTGATVKLTQSGQADINGTGVTRTDDQTLSATFDTQGKNTGFWDLVVTNSNGRTGTLANAVFVDFAGGSASLVDNLMRPRLGTRTRVDVTIFNSGRVTLKVYTAGGEPVATLLDQVMPEGSFSAYWDGKTSLGHTVASGLYLLEATGPKLQVLNKVIVIK